MNSRNVIATSIAAVVIVLALSRGLSHGRTVVGVEAPDINAERWINSKGLTLAELRGKVVLVEFWTFGCYNCRNVEPHVQSWYEKYAGQGLVVVGVHSPEQSFERNVANVEKYVRERGISYPIAIDDDFAIWNRYGNNAWPSLYLVDKRGFVRLQHVGEGAYAETETQLQALLREN
jgi:thiol-disulfide isomerase/thioredoxin